MLKRLSYSLSENSPGWPGNPTVQVTPHSLISEGKTTNEYRLSLFNHFGSHMDGPKHFNDHGPRLGELPLKQFVYERPLLLDIPKSYEELVTADDLRHCHRELKSADLLMIRSGFSEKRHSDPQGYSERGPGVSSKAALHLIQNYPNLKAIAVDWISLASYAHLEDGILAHQHLLGNFRADYMCIIEDLNFAGLDNNKLLQVWSVPLFVDGIDSAPVTVLAELKS
ncbi:cyclase family protein [Paenibacillus xerothermodurans]|uniref:Cyclase family protein n=1 Tax=Paenibacillus xerothermodurans TaxID=1977292 RepID=A0A2W1N9I6_PAEXE|nr:cyclase family protein [Paenibacillus xerothermodurans]PZE20594.1 cyclase family protein [Paenibacillus xerothermodurans]